MQVIIKQRELKPGDVVSIHSPGQVDGPYSTATVITIENGMVKLQRPYIIWEPIAGGFGKHGIESFSVFHESDAEWKLFRREGKYV